MKTNETTQSAAEIIFYAVKDFYVRGQSDFTIGINADGDVEREFNHNYPDFEVALWDTSGGWNWDADSDHTDMETTDYWDENEDAYLKMFESHVIEIGIENSVTWAEE